MNDSTDIEVRRFMRSEGVLREFQKIMAGMDAERYIASVLLVVAADTRLQECTPQSVLISAMRAATLGLSVDPVMKQAYLVGYRARNRGVTEAQLIVHYKGYIRLAFNTGLYDKIHVRDVFEGQRVIEDEFGDHKIEGEPTGAKVNGRIALFRLLNGFYKDVYMTTQEIRGYAQKYAPGYSDPKSLWRTLLVGDKDNWMEKKTPLRVLFNHWGVFDPAVKKALAAVDVEPSAVSEERPVEVSSVIRPSTLGRASAQGEERPYKPEKLKRVIYYKAQALWNEPVKDEERNALEAIDPILLRYLTSYGSIEELPSGLVKALLWWMDSAPKTVIEAEGREAWSEAEKLELVGS